MARGRAGHRGRARIAVLPSYPQHQEPRADSRISGSDSDARKKDASRVSAHENGNGHEEYYPSLDDVSEVRDILRRSWPCPSSSRPRKVTLPDEVIDMILDEAEYWPSVVTTLRTTPFVISTDGDRECLRTAPLCYDIDAMERSDGHGNHYSAGNNDASRLLLHRGMHPCRKIVFDISSHDQGWGGGRNDQGTFRGSYTWFSAYISPHRPYTHIESISSTSSPNSESASSESDSNSEKRSVSSHPRPFLPEPGKLQCNRTATRSSSDYHIVWHYRDDIHPESDEAERIEQETGRGRATLDGREVRDMKVGDEVSVWLRARFSAWQNHVDALSVRVFWAA
ncbi:hypothetical protein UA08_07799 [Talaromyces atroroseus]|uniref:Uncharacterized protein n=1 Tax=Talaromyces atroroseus TaxID=1441469 RepID=A0A225A899_TALAT|nr:hypothetical protein UA08_07799 [Talaromyces atroroseus]OKL56961.1 hypothetical protein UA08_07799 [Talaromyces atroroseus]